MLAKGLGNYRILKGGSIGVHIENSIFLSLGSINFLTVFFSILASNPLHWNLKLMHQPSNLLPHIFWFSNPNWDHLRSYFLSFLLLPFLHCAFGKTSTISKQACKPEIWDLKGCYALWFSSPSDIWKQEWV